MATPRREPTDNSDPWYAEHAIYNEQQAVADAAALQRLTNGEPLKDSTVPRTSATAAVLRSLPTQVRRRLHISPTILAIADVIVGMADGHQRGTSLDDLWQQVMDQHKRELEPILRDPESLEGALTNLTDEITAFTASIKGGTPFQTWLAKAIGRKRYDQLKQALKSDAEPVAATLAQVVQAFLPLALAAQDAAAPLSGRQLENVGLQPDGSLLAAALLVHDSLLQALEFLNPGAHTVPETTTERVEHELREIIQSAFPGLLREAAPYMLRKLEGASFVLDHGSPDAASQAANSLIELTIRLLASHYSDAEVLEWVRQEMPNRVDELTREKDGQPVPTRKAQALCYIYAKSPAVSESLLHELAAASLTTLLARLQDVKHDDQGDASELLTVREAFIALTGALTLALRIRSAQFLDGQSTQPQRIVDLNVQQSRFV